MPVIPKLGAGARYIAQGQLDVSPVGICWPSVSTHVEKEDLGRNVGSMWQGKDGAAGPHQYHGDLEPKSTLRTLSTE
jgi:hypothetical protein